MTVLASLRGTGCSSGEFDVFSWRSALDGREVIDDWIARQPWSNGDVGDLRALLQRPHRDDGRLHAAEAPAGGQRLRPVRRPLPRHRLSRRRHQLRLPAAVDRRRAAGLRRRRRHGRRPVSRSRTRATQCAANQAGRSRTVARGPADPRPRRHRQRVVPLALAGQPTSSASRCRSTSPPPTRTSRPAAAGRPTSSTTCRRASRGGSCWSTASTARRPRTRRGPHRMDGLLDARRAGSTSAWPARPTGDRLRTARRRRRSRVILGYQGEGRAVGEIASDGFPLGQTQFTDAYVTAGGG